MKLLLTKLVTAAVLSFSLNTTVNAQANDSQKPQTLDEAIIVRAIEPPLNIKTGQRLSIRLKQWLEEQGNELSWDAHASTHGRIRDIEFLEEFHAQGSLVQVLKAILTPFSFEADVIDMGTKKRVVVRNSSNRF